MLPVSDFRQLKVCREVKIKANDPVVQELLLAGLGGIPRQGDEIQQSLRMASCPEHLSQ
jgi:hypothetical protein